MIVSITMACFILSYIGWISYQGGMYFYELSKATSDDKVKNCRSFHIFVEFDQTHPSCYNFLIASMIKRGIFVAMALTMVKYYCFALGLSAIT